MLKPLLAAALLAPLVATAQQTPARTPAAIEREKEDIAIHRRIAAAHEAAAKCIEAGKGEKACHEQLARDCQGIAIGKHCGMRHRH